MDHSTPPISPTIAPGPTPAPGDPFLPLSYDQLQSDLPPRDWLWRGYLLPGAITLLTGLWKSGKTTLLSVLLARLKAGGELAGLPTRAGRAVVVTEESPHLWWQRGRLLSLEGHVQWLCRPFRGRPTTEQWHDLIDQVGRMHDQQAVDLLAIDPLASLAPLRTENNAAEMLAAIAPLQRLTCRGLSVLLCHHPRKGRVRPGQAARGSGALPACVDVVVEMHALSRHGMKDRRRRLRAYSRYAETPASWAVEWTADGLDYRGLGPSGEPDFAQGWPVLRGLLEAAPGPMTRRDLMAAWPETATPPAALTLWKWLGRVVQEGQVTQQGKGTPTEPFAYSLPGKEVMWRARQVEVILQGLTAESGPPG